MQNPQFLNLRIYLESLGGKIDYQGESSCNLYFRSRWRLGKLPEYKGPG